MTHPTERGRQRARATNALRESCARLANRFGVEAPVIPERFPRDPSHLPTLQIEAVTAFLDSLDAVVPPVPAPDPITKRKAA